MTLAHRAGVDVSLLHPIFVRRLEALAAEVPGLRIVSGVRTQAEQQYLYDGWRAGRPGFNMAANPSRVIGQRTIFGDTFTARGSWHVTQPSGWGYAVDLNYGELDASARGAFDEAVPYHSRYVQGAPSPFGLYRTVEGRSPEPWHVQPVPTVTTPFDDPTHEDDDMTPEQAAQLAQVREDVKNIRAALRKISPQIDGLVRTSTETAQALEGALADQGVHATSEQIRAALDGLVLRVEG